MSEIAKFNRNTLVMVRIRRFWINVKMTNAFPTIARSKIVMYKMICMRLVVSHDDNDVDVDAVVENITLATVVVARVVAFAVLLFIVAIQVIAIDSSEVAFSRIYSSNDVIILPLSMPIYSSKLIS